MTRSEALAEARRRWGDGYFAATDGLGTPCLWRNAGISFESECIGFGSTWEAAFADADRREGKGGAL